jgi:hypothetical protein
MGKLGLCLCQARQLDSRACSVGFVKKPGFAKVRTRRIAGALARTAGRHTARTALRRRRPTHTLKRIEPLLLLARKMLLPEKLLCDT